jgi:signal transduction histidine kinase
MTDAERLLQILLHDLRTPIGVAQGYLRMMQEGHLTTAAEVERAVAKALQALGQTAGLCQNAGDFLEGAKAATRVVHVRAATFADQIESIARTHGFTVESGRIPASAGLALSADIASTCEAVVHVLTAAGNRSKAMRIDADAGELRFVVTEDRESPSVAGVPLDGWSQKLPVAVACRRITWSSGRILKLETGNGLIVAFPLTETPEKDVSA